MDNVLPFFVERVSDRVCRLVVIKCDNPWCSRVVQLNFSVPDFPSWPTEFILWVAIEEVSRQEMVQTADLGHVEVALGILPVKQLQCHSDVSVLHAVTTAGELQACHAAFKCLFVSMGLCIRANSHKY